MKRQIKLIAAVAAATAALVITGNAASMFTSNTAPTVDGEDLNNYAADTGSHKFFSENSGAGLTRGQTFTTGADPVMLNSFSYKLRDTTQQPLGSGGLTYNIRVGTVTGAGPNPYTFTSIQDEVATQTTDWLGTASKQVNGEEDTKAPLQWATFTFDTPVALAANTTYGFDLGQATNGNGWQSGIPYLAFSGNEVAGDDLWSGVTTQDPGLGNGDANLTTNRDLIYHLDLSVVPEPSTTALLGLGGLALIFRRRK